MKKLLMNALVLTSVAGVAACASTAGTSDQTLTQAPYAEERTVGSAPAREVVQSAEPVFETRQVK